MLSITKSLSVKVLGLATKTLGKPDEKLVTKAMLTTPSHPITLMASSPQNFCNRKEIPHPPYMGIVATPHQVGGSMAYQVGGSMAHR